MSNIDFLSQNNNDSGDESTEKKGPEGKIEWTEPVKKDKSPTDKEKNKKSDEHSDDDSDVSAWLKKLRSKTDDNMKGAKELKKSKEAVAEYQKIFSKSKDPGLKKADIEELNKDEKQGKGGIAQIIKSKLAALSNRKGIAERMPTIKTNLIKGEDVTFFNWGNKIRVLVINLVLTAIIVGTAYGYLLYKENKINQENATIVAEIEKVKSQISGYDEEIGDIDAFQKKVKLAKYLLDNHVYWSNFFEFLEGNLLKTVYLEREFHGNVNGTFSLSSKGESFSDLTYQSRVLRNNDIVTSVSIKSGRATVDKETKAATVTFSLDLKVDPQIFYK